MKRKTIGVIGAGFGGLYTGLHLIRRDRDVRFDITLFDRNNYFLYTPFLHEVATGTVNSRHVVVPIRKIADPRRVHIRNEFVLAIDLASKSVTTASGVFSFDHIVIATGGETNFHDLPGAAENSITFKTINDAIVLRDSIVKALERAAIEKNPGLKMELLTFNVAGAGCTGVELISEMAEFIDAILERDYPEIERARVRLNLIEAAGNVLSTFPSYLSRVANERLSEMGIEVMLESPIAHVTGEYIRLQNGRKVPNGLLVWAAGLKARSLDINPPVDRDQMGRIIVDEHMEIPGFKDIHAIGDGARFLQGGQPLASTASVAVQQARYTAERIIDKKGDPFRFNYRGDMASLGFMFGVCDIYGWQLRRFSAWFIWKFFKLAMMPKYKNRFQILSDWLITFIFKRDTARLA